MIALILALVACGSRTESVAPAGPVLDPVRPPPKHAVLLILDTTRADVLADTDTPALDSLASRGTAVERAWSAGTWTVPSVVSLFTGMSVRRHAWDLPTGKIGKYPPIPDVPTLATVLHDAGFGTFGLYANPYLAEELGFDRGFDEWRRSADKAMPKQFGKHVAGAWADGRRHFAYIHFLGPHSPLRPSAESAAKWGVDASWLDPKIGFDNGVAKRNEQAGSREAYANAYRAVVEDTDRLVGEVLAGLGPHRDDTLVVLTSDHGELLGEHDVVGHGTHVWEALTHVPLVVDRASSMPPTYNGASIPALVTQFLGVQHVWPSAADAALPLVSQRENWLAVSPDGRHKGIWAGGGPKGLVPTSDGPPKVYDLMADVGEMTALPEFHGLPEARASWEARVPRGETSMERVALAPKAVEELKALGYLQ